MNRKEKQKKTTYGVAVIGCGHMGEEHLKHIYCCPGIRIRCVCDLDPVRAEKVAWKYRADAIEADAQKCIARPDVDIVIIATYPSTHLPLLKLCIQHKKHVICEKPIASNLHDGEEFVNLVKSNPEVKVLVGHILRHNQTYKIVADMIHSGAIGKPVVMRMTQNHHCMNWERYLTLLEETSPVIDCGVHYLDVMQWFTGEKVSGVSGVGVRTEQDVPEGKLNYEMITVTMSGGSVGFYEAGWTKTISSNNTKEFVGPKGNIRIIFCKDRQSHQEEGDLIEYYSLEDRSYHSINVIAERKPTDIQLECLISMIENDSPATPTIDEVYESFRIAVKADELIKQRQEVRL